MLYIYGSMVLQNPPIIYTQPVYIYTGRFVMFSVITNIYNKKTKGPTVMELFTATEKIEKVFFRTRDVPCVHHG
jgi:hypothetical protein